MDYQNDEWQRKGATLSDKTARQEFGLTQDEIYDAIDAGTLHYRQAAMHGNPWLGLLRREVEGPSPGHPTATVTLQNGKPGPSWHGSTARSNASGLSWLRSRSGDPSSAPASESERSAGRSLSQRRPLRDTRSVVSLSRRVLDSPGEPGELTVDFGETERQHDEIQEQAARREHM